VIHFDLVSSTGIKFSDDVYEVLIPTRDGVIAVLEDHMPLMSAGQPGVISVRKNPGDNRMEEFAVSGGVMEVDGKNLRFLSDDVTSSDEASEQEAEAALAKARQLVESADSRKALQDAQNTLQHSQARLHVARLKKRRHV
jgi:F-type H+-transporting ATPase subunit epsilon